MARRDKFQSARIRQNSRFLKLPGEIRTLIYRAALVKNTPIDLWPHEFIKENRAHPDLLERLRKTVQDDSLIDEALVRDQHDLDHVRKEMATGLLATCKQINREAAMLFWRENTFRFSSDFDWRGLRRFLISIGPEARSRIRSLEVSPPGWTDDRTYQIIDEQQYIALPKMFAAKNHPKMHMPKALHVFGFIDNFRFICEMLRSEQTLQKLNLVIMDGWQLGCFNDIYSEYPSIQTSVLLDLQSLKHFCTVSVVLECGSAMTGPFNREFLNQVDFTLVAHPGSRVVPERPFKEWTQNSALADCRNITELQVWAPPLTDDILLEGINIFDMTDGIASPACGGKVHKPTYYGRKKLERRLKGFGGCRFVERRGDYCNDCNQHLPNLWDTYFKHEYWCTHCKIPAGYTWKEGIEVRKVDRERRVAQRAEEEDGNTW
ncbi:hypothetical protein BLS_005782 [Venturia inaequalis]|uniref:DUF7730 domain-containing protein n=1 Tax=Venturia inaequalis TaxID=5025 RepID=A0A8H3YLJ8_VENIN|nr:hypothetical protein EG328_010043 [Venturia inaequalis]KAE9968621.1 hypothetical protein BLS_005782 [Venturia inaequalis]KAE9988844.1 hypothetical protein EG327_003207 [Venturia inaequalis]RDI76750.1 hypothetical protein Vi05172_g13272 [Venturia inaequalis]